MQRLLNANEAAQVSDKLHDNALLQACQQVWPERQEEIVSVTARAEDIFCEAAWLMDELIDADENSNSMTLIRELWSKVVNHIIQWNSNVSLQDRYLIASTVFHLVATSFSLHWRSYFCNTLYDAIITMMDEKRPSPHDLHEHQQHVRQQEELTEAIVQHATELNDWINKYIDDADTLITDEIILALNPPKVTKKNENKGAQTIIRPLKDTSKDEIVKTSFNYNPHGVTDSSKNMRLSEIFSRMRNQKLIDKDSNLKEFLQIFSGEEVTVRIAWTGNDNILHYLFDEWVNKRKYIPKPKGGLWKTAAARFYYRGKDKDGVYYNDPYTAEELRKTENPMNPSDDLEFIIELLKPDIRTRRFND